MTELTTTRAGPRSTETDAVASSFSDSKWAEVGLRKLPPLFASLPVRVQQVPLLLSARPPGFSAGVASSPLQRALAATFLAPPPALHELLADARWQQAPEPSRLPARA